MPETKEMTTSSEQLVADYMMDALKHSLEVSNRLESRSERAFQLFLTLFTALAGGGVVVVTSVQDPDLRHTLLALDLGAITGMGVLTFVWILASTLAQGKEWVVRYHLHRFFHDLAPDVMDRYGRNLVLKLYRDALYRKGLSLEGWSMAAFFSLVAFALFDSIASAATVYTGLLALRGTASWPLPVITGVLCLLLLLVIWRLGVRNLERYKDAARKLPHD